MQSRNSSPILCPGRSKPWRNQEGLNPNGLAARPPFTSQGKSCKAQRHDYTNQGNAKKNRRKVYPKQRKRATHAAMIPQVRAKPDIKAAIKSPARETGDIHAAMIPQARAKPDIKAAIKTQARAKLDEPAAMVAQDREKLATNAAKITQDSAKLTKPEIALPQDKAQEAKHIISYDLNTLTKFSAKTNISPNESMDAYPQNSDFAHSHQQQNAPNQWKCKGRPSLEAAIEAQNISH